MPHLYDMDRWYVHVVMVTITLSFITDITVVLIRIGMDFDIFSHLYIRLHVFITLTFSNHFEDAGFVAIAIAVFELEGIRLTLGCVKKKS